MDASMSSTSASTGAQYFPFGPSSSSSNASSNAQSSSSLSLAANDRPLPGSNNAAPFLADFNLIAEAAKRAQMAVLTRDLESIGL